MTVSRTRRISRSAETVKREPAPRPLLCGFSDGLCTSNEGLSNRSIITISRGRASSIRVSCWTRPRGSLGLRRSTIESSTSKRGDTLQELERTPPGGREDASGPPRQGSDNELVAVANRYRSEGPPAEHDTTSIETIPSRHGRRPKSLFGARRSRGSFGGPTSGCTAPASKLIVNGRGQLTCFHDPSPASLSSSPTATAPPHTLQTPETVAGNQRSTSGRDGSSFRIDEGGRPSRHASPPRNLSSNSCPSSRAAS